MPSQEEADRAALGALLKGLSVLEVRELCIAALRAARRQDDGGFSVNGELGRKLVPVLQARIGQASSEVTANGIAELFETRMATPEMAQVFEFLHWFVRAGFAVPVHYHRSGFAFRYHYTERGRAFLDAPADHPLLPGYVERLRQRCAGLPDDVVALFSDAQACMDHMLLRPAIALLGVAYEHAVEHVTEELFSQNRLVDLSEAKAAKRIRVLTTELPRLVPTPGGDIAAREKHDAVKDALDFATALRRRRNDASHTAPTYGFDDRAETEELIVSAGRHLPGLWALRVP